MSGHSKWSTIRHKKGAADAKRGKTFTKLIREITVAAREGGKDIDVNFSLRAAVLKARTLNMPSDNIERAIKKGCGELEGEKYEEIIYEGYGPGGVAIIIQCLTDNRNRTTADVRNMLNKSGGSLGETGCVSYLFSRKGLIVYNEQNYSENDIMEAAIDAGAEDVVPEDGFIEVKTAPKSFYQVLEAMNDFSHEQAEISRIPLDTLTVSAEQEEKLEKLFDMLENHDDIQSVTSNLNFTHTDDRARD